MIPVIINKINKEIIAIVLCSIIIMLPFIIAGQEINKNDKKTFKKAEKLFKQQQYQQALELYNGLLSSNSSSYKVLYKTAVCNCETKRYDLAIKQYNQLLGMLEKMVDDLTFSNDKKDQKKREELKDLKWTVNNKYKSCQSKKEQAKQRVDMLNDSAREQRLDNYKKSASGGKKDKTVREQQAELYKNDQKENEIGEKANVEENDFPKQQMIPFNKSMVDLNANLFNNYVGLKSRGENQQILELKEYISNQYTRLKSSDKLFNNHYEDIINISHSWIEKNYFKQYEWFEELKNKENNYRKILEEYNKLVRERTTLENEIYIAKNDSAGLSKKIKITTRDSLDAAHIKNIILKEELRAKLSTIPQSVVLIGRIKHTQELSAFDRSRILINAMTDVAIKTENGQSILNYQLNQNDKLSQLYQLNMQGIAQTADKFYTSLIKSFKEDIYTYEIYRMEVFPFNNNIKNITERSEIGKEVLEHDLDINIYRVTSANYKVNAMVELIQSGQADINEAGQSSFDEHGLGQEERTFINTIFKTSEKFNKKYNEKIKEATNEYFKEDKKYDSILTTYNQLNNIQRKEITLVTNKIDSLNTLYENIDIQKEKILENDYNKAKNQYKDYYSKKYQSVNQLAVKKASEFEHGYEVGFTELAQECYEAVLNNLSKKASSTTIFKESNGGQSLLSLQGIQVDYYPVVDSFQVLSMIQYEKDKEYYSALNLVFKIDWTLNSENELAQLGNDYTMNSEEVNSDNNQAGEKNKNINSYKSNNDKVTSLRESKWMFYENNPTNIFRFLYSSGVVNSWRLPSYDELRAIVNQSGFKQEITKINQQENSGKLPDILKIPSGDTFYNDDNIKEYRGIEYNVSTNSSKEKNVDEGSKVYLILIEKNK